MVSDKINNLFNFIGFLHANISNFKEYDKVIDDYRELIKQASDLNPEQVYSDKIQYKRLANEIDEKYKVLKNNVIDLLEVKINELNVCDFENLNTIYNWNISEIDKLKNDFDENDIIEILKCESKYIEYRLSTKLNYLTKFGRLNSYLDSLFKGLFAFFSPDKKENNQVSKNGIFELTTENLKNYGLSSIQAIEFYEVKGELQCDEGNFFAPSNENKVYTGIEFFRQTCFNNGRLEFPFNCPNLIPEYFDLALNEFKQEQKQILDKLYNESDQLKKFVNVQIEFMQNRIETQKSYLIKMRHHKFKNKENEIKICEAYIQYLKRKIEEPQQAETNKPYEIKKEFKDFFIKDLSIEIINEIQEDFSSLIGKRMAYLIYLLDVEFKVIEYALKGKNDSRKHFVEALKDTTVKMQGIDKYFATFTSNLKLNDYTSDNDYIKIKEKLTKAIE